MCREVTSDLADGEPIAKSRHLGNEIKASVLRNTSRMNGATSALESHHPEEIPSTEKDKYLIDE
jgi:hypothetical protein